MKIHNASLVLLYLITAALACGLFYHTSEYFKMGETERPHHSLHDDWKPGGVIGHSLGVAGSILMILLLLYSVRKRSKFLRKAGSMSYWLNYHIWMGITGPVLVTFHTAFKFGGIVAVSFWSMTAVAVSGFLGRYVYLQIPRMNNGLVMSAGDIAAQNQSYLETLTREFPNLAEKLQNLLDNLTQNIDQIREQSLLRQLVFSNFQLNRVLSESIRTLITARDLQPAEIKRLKKILRAKIALNRKVTILRSSQKILNHWHLIHKPFAAVMYAIMLIHIAVAVIFGYKWIF